MLYFNRDLLLNLYSQVETYFITLFLYLQFFDIWQQRLLQRFVHLLISDSIREHAEQLNTIDNTFL